MIPGISPVLWDSLHQLHAQGCPIDLAEMYRSAAPVHLENKLPYAAQPVAPVRHGFLLALRLVLYVRSALTVDRLEMAADWLPAPVECFRSCRSHQGDLCAHSDRVHLRHSGVSSHLMNFGVLPRYLEPGNELDGLLLGFCPATLPTVGHNERREVTICVRDADGYAFHFPLVLQPGARAGQHFHSQSKLELE